MSLIIGIDPGASGGIAWLKSGVDIREGLGCAKMPETPADVAHLLRSLVDESSHDLTCVVMERVGATPQMGVSSAFTFGNGVGVLRGVCAGLRLSMIEVSPLAWQKALGLSAARGKGRGELDAKDRYAKQAEKKAKLKAAAAQLFPWLRITNHVADALLIVEYGRLIHGAAWPKEEPW